MQLSDLLTLIGIILAILAFISEKNREYVFLKFSLCHRIIIGIVFFYLHFLISFDWWTFYMPQLNKLKEIEFVAPSDWAYIIAMITLGGIIYRIFWAKFPRSNLKKAIKYYRKLLLRNDIAFLAELVERYHLKGIISHLKARKQVDPTIHSSVFEEESDKAFLKTINTNARKYGNSVYYEIVRDDLFIDSLTNINPYIFTPIITELNKEILKEEEFVNRFLKVLIVNKNGHFFREVRNNLNLDATETYQLSEERPILYALFKDANVASINAVWRAIGEQAIIELQKEAKKSYSLLREVDFEQDNDTIWSYRIKIAVVYFDIMVRAVIKQNIKDHMWMYYYEYFVKGILDNMDKVEIESTERSIGSRNFDLIEEIFINMMRWKEVMIKNKNGNLSRDLYDCMGRCIYEVAISDKLNLEDKRYLINWVWNDWINTMPVVVMEKEGPDAAEKAITDSLFEEGLKMFKQPSLLYPSRKNSYEGQSYKRVIEYVWGKRDTVVLTGFLGERADQFEREVLQNL